MFHLAAFYKSDLGNTADTDINAVTDDLLNINNNHIVIPESMKLIGAYAGSATLNRAKFETPSMRQIAGPYIRPVNVNTLPPTNANMWIMDYSPYQLMAGEELQVKATSAVAMTEAFYALAWLQQRYVNPPVGPITPLRATSTMAAVTGAWTSVSLTWGDTIPAGTYALVLSECFSTNAIAHRWVLDGYFYRPGFLSGASNAIRLPDGINKGQFGQLGTFRSNNLPRLQVLCNGADNAHTAFAYAIKVGGLAL